MYLVASGQASRRTDGAALLGSDRHTVARWLTRYARGGRSALLDLSVPAGKHPALSPEHTAQLQQARQRPDGLASYAAIRCWIAQTYGVTLTYNAIHTLVRYKLKAKPKVARPAHKKR